MEDLVPQSVFGDLTRIPIDTTVVFPWICRSSETPSGEVLPRRYM
jgi:hypothetical protein